MAYPSIGRIVILVSCLEVVNVNGKNKFYFAVGIAYCAGYKAVVSITIDINLDIFYLRTKKVTDCYGDHVEFVNYDLDFVVSVKVGVLCIIHN